MYNILEGEAFGIKSKSAAEPAKSVIFPTLSEDDIKKEEIYKKTHGSFEPGEQKRRDYHWYVNPDEVRFGRKGDTIALNGVSKNVSDCLKNVEDKPPLISAKKVIFYIILMFI